MDGERLGSYRLIERLGAGAMGTVWKAEGDEGVVALKVFHPHLAERRGFMRRVQREADAGRDVVDDHVVRTLDLEMAIADGAPVFFLVLEHVEGRTLRQLLDAWGPLPEPLVREVALQAARGLAAIHARRLVHRDVKPENLLITDDHRVRIMDLGIAKALDAESELTREGQFAGSLLYASPEQIDSREVGPAADLYGLGVTLHVLATGRNPFRRETAAAVVRAHSHETPPRLRDERPDASPFLDAVVETLLKKRPEERFSTALALVEALETSEGGAWWREREALSRAAGVQPRVPVGRETACAGRDAERARFAARWRAAVEGSGGALLVEGEAGIGKSRLVSEAIDALAPRAAHVLYGSFPPSGGDALAESVAAHRGAGAAGPRGAGTLLETLAAQGPVLWVVEDLHHASPEARRSAFALARAAAGRRALVVLTTRPGLADAEVRDGLAGVPHERLAPARLGVADVHRVLTAAFGSAASADRWAEAVTLRTDGVPLFVADAVRTLREGRRFERSSAPDLLQALGSSAGLAAPVRDLVAARLAGLERAQRELIDAAAVQGYRVDADLLARVLGTPRMRVLRDVAHLERTDGLLRGERHGVRFDHHHVQEVAYEAIPAGLRAELHAATADAIEARRREAGGGRGDAAAPPSGDETVLLARHHVRGSRPQAGRSAIVPAVRVLIRTDRYTELVALGDEALAIEGLLGDDERARVQRHRANSLHALGRRDEERAAALDALDCARRLNDAALESGALLDLAQHACETGAADEAVGRVREGIAVLERAHAGATEIWNARSNLGVVLMTFGRHAEALAAYERLAADVGADGPLETRVLVTMNRVHALRGLGDPEAAVACAREAAQLAAVHEFRSYESEVPFLLARALVEAGRAGEAAAPAQRAFDGARAAGKRFMESVSLACLAEADAEAGLVPRALERAALALALARECGDRDAESTAWLALARAQSGAGRAAESQASLEAGEKAGAPEPTAAATLRRIRALRRPPAPPAG